MDIRIKYEGLINSYIDADGPLLTEEEWHAAIRKEADDLKQDISDEDIRGIIRVLGEEGLVC